jgi:hypothetical protein
MHNGESNYGTRSAQLFFHMDSVIFYVDKSEFAQAGLILPASIQELGGVRKEGRRTVRFGLLLHWRDASNPKVPVRLGVLPFPFWN